MALQTKRRYLPLQLAAQGVPAKPVQMHLRGLIRQQTQRLQERGLILYAVEHRPCAAGARAGRAAGAMGRQVAGDAAHIHAQQWDQARIGPNGQDGRQHAARLPPVIAWANRSASLTCCRWRQEPAPP